MLVLYGAKLENKRSILLQERAEKKGITIADTIMITLNNLEMNLLKIKQLKSFKEINDQIEGEFK